jgi:hypothetical protein
MFAGTHARGRANSFLWISEWGVIQASDLTRSEEISDRVRFHRWAMGFASLKQRGKVGATAICGAW